MPELLPTYEFKISYGPQDDRLNHFYIPALERSLHYDRAAGYFSSSALAIAAAGIVRLIQNGGRMRLLVGAELDQADVEAIEAGSELVEHVQGKLLSAWDDPQDLLMRHRLEALSWMVAERTLEIRVVLPMGPDGLPLSGGETIDYYHPKEGLFTDADGNQIAFSGSVNESLRGWTHHYEQFSVYRSWDASQPYLAQVVSRFERLWTGHEPDWIALPVGDAVREHLIKYRPDQAPLVDPYEVPAPKLVPVNDDQGCFDASPPASQQRERIVVEFLRDAPYLPNAARLGAVTAAVDPWPHQHRVADAVVQRFPERFLIADEVGLGKTIEAGLAIRQLVLSGRAKRCLILTPKSVQRQWQDELYEKFLLDVPRYDGKGFITRAGEERPAGAENPFDAETVLLVSSQLVKRQERQGQLLAAQPWDLVIVDEAHHARRRDFLSGRYRPNRLLELLNELQRRTQSLVLLTATPMQVDPIEVWDLLKLLGLGGRWGADAANFLRFFREVRKQDFLEIDWDFVLDMVREYFRTGGGEDPVFAEAARKRIGVIEWQRIQSLPTSHDRRQVLKQLSPAAQSVAVEFAKRHTPLRRLVFRNTRGLLREYVRQGRIEATIPYREPRPIWIDMEPAEKELYNRIEEYIADFYAKFEAERKGLGFIMTVYRRRLTSSFYAIEQSLTRRLRYLEGLAPDLGLDDDDLEQEDLELDVSEDLPNGVSPDAREEIQYVQDFLRALRQLGTDSKFQHLVQLLSDLFRKRDTVVIFTQYTDTMDYLREQLRQVYGSQVACYSGRGGEEWHSGGWARTTKEEIKNEFRSGERIKILLCTEAASEGLNLQTCGVLINYDMPWNPMRVEQRIGRIDRIGQRYPTVWIRNYFYEDTIEAEVYRRLSDRIDWFKTVIGDLQPILSRIARSIETLAMLPPGERRSRLEEEIEALRAELDQQQVAFMSLDEYADENDEMSARRPPVTLPELEKVLTGSSTLAQRFLPHPSIEHAYLLCHGEEEIGVTFDPHVFDAHPDTLRLLAYGDRVFEKLLAEVEPPDTTDEIAGLLRCCAEDLAPVQAWFAPSNKQPLEIMCLDEVNQALAAEVGWEPGAEKAAMEIFGNRLLNGQRRDSLLSRQRQQAERLALHEQARQVLVRAALVEIALGQKPDLFGEALPWDYSQKAIAGLRRHKYPFAPLLRLVDTQDLNPSPIDPYLVAIQGDTPEALRKRLDQLKVQAGVLVAKLAAAGKLDDAAVAAGDTATRYAFLAMTPATSSTVR